MRMAWFLFAASAASVGITQAAVQGPELPRASVVPGGVFITPVEGAADQPPTVTLDGKRVMVIRSKDRWLAVVGIPLSTKLGPASISVKEGTAAEVPISFNVVDKQYPMQSLKVAPGKVDLSPEDQDVRARNLSASAQRSRRILPTRPPRFNCYSRCPEFDPAPTGPVASSTTSRATLTPRWISPLLPAHPSRLPRTGK